LAERQVAYDLGKKAEVFFLEAEIRKTLAKWRRRGSWAGPQAKAARKAGRVHGASWSAPLDKLALAARAAGTLLRWRSSMKFVRH
jgi:hypothetical protein